LVEYDFGVAPNPVGARAPTVDNPVHDTLRNIPAAIAQIDAFLRPAGRVVHTCKGICDPN
jgi:hypothetical protein